MCYSILCPRRGRCELPFLSAISISCPPVNDNIPFARKRGHCLQQPADLIKFGVADKVLKVLENAGIPYEIFSEIKPNPTVSNVKAGVEDVYKRQGKYPDRRTFSFLSVTSSPYFCSYLLDERYVCHACILRNT